MQESQQLRSSLEAEIRKQLTEESQELQSEINHNEAKIAALEEALLQERNVSENLQAKTQSMETRLADMERKFEDQARISQLQRRDKQEAFVELELSVAKCEASQMATITSTNKDDKLGMEVDAGQPQKWDRIIKDSPYIELEQKLKNKMTQFLQSRSSAMEEHVQTQLNQLASDFGTWMDKEREIRLSLDEQVKAAKQSANAAVQAVEVVSAKLVMNQTTSESNRESDASAIANQKVLIQGLGERVGAAEHSVTEVTKVVEAMRTDLITTKSKVAVLADYEARLQSLDERIRATEQFATPVASAIKTIRTDRTTTQSAVAIHGTCIQNLTGAKESPENETRSARDGLQKSIDALWLRTKNLNDWQQNFSTRGLFDAIVKHLNESFVSEHVFNFTKVLKRVQRLESQLGDGSSKKRKLTAQPSAITT
ncbi:hypothetical protein ISF_02429 [Cordyceps fumosorosea ARSEF 2679]|uniref:Uncharacterized protein n=1 Tax=Cordyceps fumosorosea (strain ARSEF 2679) TaxID=1081104 RepID=A0A168BRI5_CORFA|nr:hypothetical protein ISF_02429 [Cordyceps fumosorosea ARSEF 2679]OAA70455.1 hypothetical protein ISF_02429 [Cordyceps fumosorosea ARSEF 2679]